MNYSGLELQDKKAKFKIFRIFRLLGIDSQFKMGEYTLI